MPVIINHRGSFKNTKRFFRNTSSISRRHTQLFRKYGEEGVKILEANTPKDTGKTASSWYYEIETKNGNVNLAWYNSNLSYGVPIAIIIQYGHATKNGGFVEGIDYINPSLKPIFDRLSNELWKEVTK